MTTFFKKISTAFLLVLLLGVASTTAAINDDQKSMPINTAAIPVIFGMA